jgi:hypothetical protein
MKASRMMSSLSPTPINNNVSQTSPYSAFSTTFNQFDLNLTFFNNNIFITETSRIDNTVLRKDNAQASQAVPTSKGLGPVRQRQQAKKDAEVEGECTNLFPLQAASPEPVPVPQEEHR